MRRPATQNREPDCNRRHDRHDRGSRYAAIFGFRFADRTDWDDARRLLEERLIGWIDPRPIICRRPRCFQFEIGRNAGLVTIGARSIGRSGIVQLSFLLLLVRRPYHGFGGLASVCL